MYTCSQAIVVLTQIMRDNGDIPLILELSDREKCIPVKSIFRTKTEIEEDGFKVAHVAATVTDFTYDELFEAMKKMADGNTGYELTEYKMNDGDGDNIKLEGYEDDEEEESDDDVK